MGLDLLRKRLKEIQENLRSGNTPEIPGMEKTYQPANPNPVETYNAPEVDVPKTTPVSTSPVTQKNNPAVNIPKPTAKTISSNKPKVDPKTGANGAKAFDDITTKSPQFGEAGVGNTDLIDAYNAGLNGEDMSRETRDNAAAGGYLEQLEAMYNAGKQDAKPSSDTAVKSTPSVDNTKVNIPSINPTAESNSKNGIDNKEKSGYTSGNTTGVINATSGFGPEYTDTADYSLASKSTQNAKESTVKYKFGDRVIYQDEYDKLSDSQKKALDAAVKEYNNKKQSGENYISLFDTYMKLIRVLTRTEGFHGTISRVCDIDPAL